MNKIEKDLKSMGYRKAKIDVWGKPVGYCMLMATIENGQWMLAGYFKGNNTDKIFCWERESFDCLETLKSAETKCYYNGCYNPSNFEFLTGEQSFEEIL